MTLFSIRTVRLALLAGVTVALMAPQARAADASAPVVAPRGPRVTVAEVRRGELTEKLAVTGTLIARDEILVGPEIDGLQVTEILAEEGDSVRQGQVLARLQRNTLDALVAQNDAAVARSDAAIQQTMSQIVQAEASLAQARQSLDRTTQLRKSGFASQAVFDQQTNDEKAAAARLAAARDGLQVAEADRAAILAQRRELLIRLARTEVKAPAYGLVARRTAKVGGTAAMAGEPLFRLIAAGEVELDAEVSEARIGQVSVGAPASVTAFERTATGKVRLVATEIDKVTRLGRVRIALGADSGFRVGGFARGVIETKRVTGLVAPVSALLYSDRGPFLQVVRDDKIVSQPVKTGVMADQNVEIVEGLSEGQKIVVKAGAFLRDGDAVTPVTATLPTVGAR